MFFRHSIITTLLLCLVFFDAAAAEKNRFLKDDPESIKQYVLQKQWDIAPKANALVLFERAVYSISKDAGGFYVTRSVHCLIKILNKDGVAAADVDVPVRFSQSHAVAFKKVKGTTYNVEDGKLVSQQLSTDQIKKDVVVNGVMSEKFSLPSVKEGSVIDYSYQIEEDMSTFFSWDFQEAIPKVYSEVVVMYPRILNVGGITQSIYTFDKFDDTKNRVADSLVPLAYSGSVEALERDDVAMHWVRRNIPAYEQEPFVYNVYNYTERIDIQVSGIYTGVGNGNIYGTWDKATEYLYKNEECFRSLSKREGFLRDDVARLTKGQPDELSKVKAIYAFVRDGFQCTGYIGLWSANLLDKVYERRSGSITELNILLVKMLRMADLEANAVLLSTRSHLRLVAQYPLLTRLNYCICQVKLADSTYYLDASSKNMPFGVLPADCYNGYSRVINNDNGEAVNLDPSLLLEKTIVAIHTTNDELNNYQLNQSLSFGWGESIAYRSKWRKDSTEVKKFVLQCVKKMPIESSLIDYNIKNLDEADKPLVVSIDMKAKFSGSHIMISPCMVRRFNENPFKADTRYYPVEMPSATASSFVLYLKIPKEYKISSCPESVVYRIDDRNEYRYVIDKNTEQNTIQLRTDLLLKDARFDENKYDQLKTFFDSMIECQRQMLVLQQ